MFKARLQPKRGSRSTSAPIPLGPFFITRHFGLVVRHYGLPHTRYIESASEDTSSWPRIRDPTDPFRDNVKTHLRYRDVAASKMELYFSEYLVADREWIVVIASKVRGFYVHVSRGIPMGL
jgi:hypothetical protein